MRTAAWLKSLANAWNWMTHKIQINRISERDFDGVIDEAGGVRLTTDSTADYKLGNAVIELKFVEEEGFDKKPRQEKIAQILQKQFDGWPVVPILTSGLDPTTLRQYERIIEGPIKKHVRKADQQLKLTGLRMGDEPCRVLVILNIGYTAISPEEFQNICLKRVRNDTNHIDLLICGGIYIYSDTFDYYFISRFEELPIHANKVFEKSSELLDAWSNLLHQKMKEVVHSGPPASPMLPVCDLSFEVSGITYVKPTPKFPKSTFWPTGEKPRDNSTGVSSCPPVGITYPTFSKKTWGELKKLWPEEFRLEDSYEEWEMEARSHTSGDETLRPYHLVPLDDEFILSKIAESGSNFDFDDLLALSADVFSDRIRPIALEARDVSKTTLIPIEYLLLEVLEIGNDQIYDLSSLSYCLEVNGFERTEIIYEKKRIFFEHGLMIAASHALKRKVDTVCYVKQRVFGGL